MSGRGLLLSVQRRSQSSNRRRFYRVQAAATSLGRWDERFVAFAIVRRTRAASRSDRRGGRRRAIAFVTKRSRRPTPAHERSPSRLSHKEIAVSASHNRA